MADRGHGLPSSSRALAVATLLAFAGSLLVLSGMALAASVIGFVVAAPLFLLFSPVLAPVALAATGMVASGALSVGGLALLSRLASAARKAVASTPDYVEEGKRRVGEVAAVAQSTGRARLKT